MKQVDEDKELSAIQSVYQALKDLDDEAKQRVFDYVCSRLSLKLPQGLRAPGSHAAAPPVAKEIDEDVIVDAPPVPEDAADDMDGISPIAKKWMRRSGLTGEQLSALFSLGDAFSPHNPRGTVFLTIV